MAGVPIVSELLEVVNICKDLNTLVKDVKNAPIEFQSSVQALTRMHGWFQSLVEEIEAHSATGERERLGSLHHCSNEITITRTALKGAQDVLLQGYAAGANRQRFHAWKKRLRWSNDHAKFEKCLRDVREHFSTMTALVGVHDMKLVRQQHETLAAFNLHLNDKPLALGYPECGGVPQDHIRFHNGLGEYPYLPMDFWRRPQRLKDCLHIMFSELPGKQHIEKLHYKLFNTSNSHVPQELTEESWPHLMRSGCSMTLAFVVGTWQMGVVNSCPNCSHRNAGDWNSWRHCRCGSSYFVSEAGLVDYEPQDGHWFGKGRSIQDWRKSIDCQIGELRVDPAQQVNDDYPASQFAGDEEQDENKPRKVRLHDSDEDYFRCMLMVFEPIWNFVCRNVFCRCILGAVSLHSNAPEIEVLSVLACPRHARSGIQPNFDAVLPASNDNEEDTYFDKFGGYGNFQRIARFLNQATLAVAFVDMDKLCADKSEDDESISELMGTYSKAIVQYGKEVLSKLRCCWEWQMKTMWEEQAPTQVSMIESWMIEEHETLMQLSGPEKSEENDDHKIGTWHRPGRFMPFLSKGRLTLEELNNIRPDKNCVCAWP